MDKEAPNFDTIKQLNPYNEEIWSARDLAPLLGYKRWENFTEAIERAKIAAQTIKLNIEAHFVPTVRQSRSGRGKGRLQESQDYLLTRYACYLVSLNGDPRKPEIATAQNYFIVAARENELRQLSDLRDQQEKRLVLRERVAEGNKKLSAAALKAGVRRESFPQFHNAGYKGMYGGRDVEEIKAHKSVPPKEDMLDRMGRPELAANEFRITQTELRLQQEGKIGEGAAITAHHEVGQEVRTAISRMSGVMPEDLPAEPSIKPLVEERRRKRKKLAVPPPQAPAEGENGPAQGSLW